MTADSLPQDLLRVRVAIVGASTLKGKDVAEVLDSRRFPATDLRLLDDDSALGQLEIVGDEMSFIQGVTAEQLEGVDFAFFSGEEKFTRQHWLQAVMAGSTVIDLSGALDDESGARLRAPWLEAEDHAASASRGARVGSLDAVAEASQHTDTEAEASRALEAIPEPAAAQTLIHVVADPAAIMLALLLHRTLRVSPVATAVATILLPASESGKRGLDEMHQQSLNLLSFQSLPTDVFDTQVAFNLLPRVGPKAITPTEAHERRIRKHFQRLAGPDGTGLAMLVVQAPTFHGLVISLYIETTEPVSLGDFAQAMAGEHVAVNRLPDDVPSNLSAASQTEILLTVTRDAARPNGLWLWAAADNFRVAADNAVRVAEGLLAAHGHASDSGSADSTATGFVEGSR